MTDAKPQKERVWQMGRSGKDGRGISLSKSMLPLLLCIQNVGSGHLVTGTSTPAIALAGKRGLCRTFLLLISKPAFPTGASNFQELGHLPASGFKKGRKCGCSDLYFEKARICNVRKQTKNKEVYAQSVWLSG